MKSLQALRVAFDAHCLVDPDTGDRIASAAATEAALFKLGITPRADDLEDAMALAGADDTGCVGWDGFKQVYTAFHRTALDPLDVVKRFMLLDAGRKGTIDRATFLKASEGTLTGAERVWDSVARPLGAAQSVAQDDVSALEMAVAMVPSPDMHELEELICLKYGILDAAAAPATTPKRRKKQAAPRHPALRFGTAPRAVTPATPPSGSAPPTPVDDLVILPSLAPVSTCPVLAEPEPTPEPEPEPLAAAAPQRDPTPEPAPEPEAPAAVASSPARDSKKEEPAAASTKAASPEKKEAPPPKKEAEEPKKEGGCCIVA